MKVFNYKVDDSTQKMEDEATKADVQGSILSDDKIEEKYDTDDYENEEVSTEAESEVDDTYVEESIGNMEVTRSPEENIEVKRINQRILIINEKSHELYDKILKQRVDNMDDYDVQKEMKDMLDT